MNSNALIGYSGLINNNYSTSMNASDIVCDSITAQHYYNIFCQTIGITIGNPEISLLYDDLTNTFTLHIYSNSIPLSRLKNDIYDSLAMPSTLVFRDGTNSTTLSNLTITGGINLGVGLTYKINGVDLKTSDIPENINLYYTDTRARLAISSSQPIIYNNVSGVISLNTTIAQATTFTSTTNFTNGSTGQGVSYSAIFGLANTPSKCGQIALIDGTSNNQYVQLYCRSNNFGVQGNITSISLEKATKIVTSLQITNVGLTANYCFIDSTGINIGVGESYKINGIVVDTDDIQESVTPVNKYYTTARCQVDARTAITLDSTGSEVVASYNNTTGIITIPPITTASITLTKLVSGTASYIVLANGTGIPTYTLVSGDIYNNSLGAFTIGVGVVTPAKLSKGTGVGQILLTGVSPYTQAFQTLNSSIVPELTNLYYTTARAQTDAKTAISGTQPILYNSSSGVISLNTTIAQATTFTSSTPLVTNSIKIKDLNYISITDTTSNLDYFKADYTGVNIDTGLTYKIGGVQLSTSDIPELINLYYTTARARLALTVSSVGSEIAAAYNNSTGILTIPAITTNSINVTKILKGTANQFLQTSSTLVNNWVSLSGDGTLTNGVMTIGNGVVSLLKLASASYSQLASAFSTLVQRDIYGGINVVKMKTEQIILTTSPYGTLDATAISKIVNITYPSIGGNSVPYCNTYATILSGITASLTGLSPTWNRVTTPTNTLEVSMYSKGDTALWKIEGQVVNYYVSPGATCNINIGVFANTASTATIIGPSSNLVSSTFVNRNIYGASTTIVTPFICYYSIGGALYPEGTCFTFTVYVSGGGGGAIACGRSANDIPSNICVTQLN